MSKNRNSKHVILLDLLLRNDKHTVTCYLSRNYLFIFYKTTHTDKMLTKTKL
eukprot:UN17092